MPDFLAPEVRSRVMSRIRGKHTGPERALQAELERLGLRFETHARDLPGTPDFVFRTRQVAVFVDGDFWHGWRFREWEGKLAPFWRDKIRATQARDRRARRQLRAAGWHVVRIWEHELAADCRRAARRVLRALGPAREGDDMS